VKLRAGAILHARFSELRHQLGFLGHVCRLLGRRHRLRLFNLRLFNPRLFNPSTGRRLGPERFVYVGP
jgi:hypothetical protein